MSKARLTLQEYEALVEQSPILSWRANTEALCDYFNDRWLDFRGRTMEQEYGNGWAEAPMISTIVSGSFWMASTIVRFLKWNIA